LVGALNNKINFVPKAVIFDWDGTLVNTIPTLFKTHNFVREKLNVPPWTMEEYKKVIHRSTREIYPEIYGDKSELAIDVLYDYYKKNHLHTLDLFIGAKELIEELSILNIPMSVVSNKKQVYLEKEISFLAWDKFFVDIIGSGSAIKDKPHPEPLNLAINNMGLSDHFDQILYVGDSSTDLKTSENSGCRSVLILNNENKDDLIQSFLPDFVFNDCFGLQKELKQVIQQSDELMTA
jgi:phosphoglycolate phosphatase